MIYLLQTVDADVRTTALDLEAATAAAGLSFFCSSAAAMALVAAAVTDVAMAVVTAVATAVLTAAGLSSFFCSSAAAMAAVTALAVATTDVDAAANQLQTTKLGRLLPS